MPRRGRGAVSAPPGRFERVEREREPAFQDGSATVATTVRFESVRTAISFNQSPDVPFDRSINPYRGCEHGCIYCYARPNHAYLGLSPGLDFEQHLVAKSNLVDALRTQLSSASYRCAPITLGAATDAYQPIERGQRLARRAVEFLSSCRHPLTIITKSSLVERDIDLLAPMAQSGLCAVMVSITTLDDALARRWEPRAAAPWRRIETIRRLSDAGIPVCVMVAPIVPFVNDSDLERIIEAAAHAGARTGAYTLLRLPHELVDIFTDWLDVHFPDRASRVLARIRDIRGGDRLNEAGFFDRMKGRGPWADVVRQRFRMAMRRNGLAHRHFDLRTDLFEPPLGAGHVASAQLSLL
ncbi:MAG: PA0069 family radical SAM protein [Burkholderiaceae bacterium]